MLALGAGLVLAGPGCAGATDPAAPAPAVSDTAPAAPAAPLRPGLRVLLTLREPFDTLEAVQARAARSAGVAVRDAAASGPRLVALTLVCDGEAACGAAMQALAGARDWITAVDAEGRRSIPRPIRP